MMDYVSPQDASRLSTQVPLSDLAWGVEEYEGKHGFCAALASPRGQELLKQIKQKAKSVFYGSLVWWFPDPADPSDYGAYFVHSAAGDADTAAVKTLQLLGLDTSGNMTHRKRPVEQLARQTDRTPEGDAAALRDVNCIIAERCLDLTDCDLQQAQLRLRMLRELTELHRLEVELGEEAHGTDWKELPPAFLCHILSVVPYKRADVKAVCSNWREAINSSLNSVTVPAGDLPLLHQLPNIRHLVVDGSTHTPCHQQQQQQQSAAAAAAGQTYGMQVCTYTWPPSAAATSAAAAAAPASTATTVTISSSSSSQTSSRPGAEASNCWAAVEPKVLNKLQTLRLMHCPHVVQQLASGLAPAPASSSSSSSSNVNTWSAPQPSLTSLRVLELNSAGNITRMLAALQQQYQLAGSPASGGQPLSTISTPDVVGGVLQQLHELHLVHCGMDEPANQQLQLLPQLPALQALQLSGCAVLRQVPDAVCGCSSLTKLVLSGNDRLTELPAGISQLTSLQVLDLSGNALLRSLGPRVGKLSSLTELNLSGPSGLWADYSTVAAPGGSGSTTDAGAAGAAAIDATAAAWCWVTEGTSIGSAAAVRAALPQLLLPALPHQQQQLLLSDLGHLINLQRLVLSNNRQLMVLPGSVSRLTQLTALEAAGCGIRWLGEDVLECGGLRELLLGDNVLAEVPDDISRLQQLEVLDVGGSRSLWRLPSSLLQLAKLARLVVPSRAIAQHVIEQLESRPIPVEVVMEPGEGFSDSEDPPPDLLDMYDDSGPDSGSDSGDGDDIPPLLD